jgi:hypothetical protein
MIKRTAKWLKTYFIPQESNGHKPHILRRQTIMFVCLVALVGELAFMLATVYVIPHSKFFGIIESNALVDETNQARTADNLGQLTIDPLLTAAAQQKANDMVANNYFAHTSPAGVTPWDWFAKVGYQFSFAGENLAVNFSDSQDVTTAWMNSPEHRANILNGQYTEIGIATAQGTYEGKSAVYVVEEFGTPASAPIAFLNSASAAVSAPTVTEPAAKPAPSVTVSTPVATPTVLVVAHPPVPTPVVKPAPKPVVSKPKQIVVASSGVIGSVTTSLSAVIGASEVATTTMMTTTVTTTTITTTTVFASQEVVYPVSAPQLNIFQRLISDPKSLANDFYIALAMLFALALILNIFIKIRIQFPRLIFGGMMVIVPRGDIIISNWVLRTRRNLRPVPCMLRTGFYCINYGPISPQHRGIISYE